MRWPSGLNTTKYRIVVTAQHHGLAGAIRARDLHGPVIGRRGRLLRASASSAGSPSRPSLPRQPTATRQSSSPRDPDIELERPHRAALARGQHHHDAPHHGAITRRRGAV
jgi:hypothetical protein